jgi:hypothetical protein
MPETASSTRHPVGPRSTPLRVRAPHLLAANDAPFASAMSDDMIQSSPRTAMFGI